MAFLKNVWYFSAWGYELSRRSMLPRKIAGVNLVLWESDDGELTAFDDVCPHRMVPLSLGKHEGDGIRCAYHGLKFSRQGCMENPHGPISKVLKPKTYILERRHGILWVWLGDPAMADAQNIPDFSFFTKAPLHSRFSERLEIAANHQLLVDNILDLSHADFLHPDTLGGGSTCAAGFSMREEGDIITARWDMSDHPALPLFRQQMPTPDSIVKAFLEVVWWPSGAMTLQNWIRPIDHPDHPGVDIMSCHVMTPIDDQATHYFYCIARSFEQDDAELNAHMETAFYEAFAREDQPIAEAQQRVLGNSNIMDMGPKLFATDKAAVAARRTFDHVLKMEMTATTDNLVSV